MKGAQDWLYQEFSFAPYTCILFTGYKFEKIFSDISFITLIQFHYCRMLEHYVLYLEEKGVRITFQRFLDDAIISMVAANTWNVIREFRTVQRFLFLKQRVEKPFHNYCVGPSRYIQYKEDVTELNYKLSIQYQLDEIKRLKIKWYVVVLPLSSQRCHGFCSRTLRINKLLPLPRYIRD